LSLEPALEAVEVEDVTTRKLLRSFVRSSLSGSRSRYRCRRRCCGWLSFSRWTRLSLRQSILHILSTNDASLVPHLIHFLPRCVRIERIHVLRGESIATKISDSEEEGTESEIDVAEDVEWKTVESEGETEEGEIGDKLEEVCIESVI
jgi:hypothetical protein